jgi:hypothetical protein
MRNTFDQRSSELGNARYGIHIRPGFRVSEQSVGNKHSGSGYILVLWDSCFPRRE